MCMCGEPTILHHGPLAHAEHRALWDAYLLSDNPLLHFFVALALVIDKRQELFQAGNEIMEVQCDTDLSSCFPTFRCCCQCTLWACFLPVASWIPVLKGPATCCSVLMMAPQYPYRS